MLGQQTRQRGRNVKKEEEGERDDKEAENLTSVLFYPTLGLLSAQRLSRGRLRILLGAGSMCVKQNDLPQNILEQNVKGSQPLNDRVNSVFNKE